jgi:hypothetical protein
MGEITEGAGAFRLLNDSSFEGPLGTGFYLFFITFFKYNVRS